MVYLRNVYLVLFVCCNFAYAKPSLKIPAIPESALALYNIHTMEIQSKQGITYHIQIAEPKKNSKAQNTLYVLDGNAFFPMILEVLSKESLSSSKLPLVVGIGHKSMLAFDRAQRRRDYLPNLLQDGISKDTHDFKANEFLDFVLHTLKPVVHKSYFKSEHEMFFGHSFGGVFVLYVLAFAPDSFTHYVCASPSLWIDKMHYQTLFARISGHIQKHKKNSKRDLPYILFTRGELESRDLDTSITSFFGAHAPNVHFEIFSNQTHGSSIPYAMRAGVKILLGIQKLEPN